MLKVKNYVLNQVLDLEFRYTLGTTIGVRKKSGMEIHSKFELGYQITFHPNFDSIFCNGNHGKKVTYLILIHC